MTKLADHIKKSPHRNRLEVLLRKVAPQLHGPLLDIGSRNRRYDHLFEERPVAIDIVADQTKDIVAGDITDLQFSDGAFQSIICLEVFEYLSSPEKAAKELFRVLAPGGVAVVSIPFMFREHQDQLRYTKSFLTTLFGDFSEITCEPIGGAATVVATICWGKIKAIPWALFRYGTMILLLPFLFLLGKTPSSTPYASGYFLILKKK